MSYQPEIVRTHKARDFTDRDGAQVQLGVMHATAGKNSRGWLSGNPRGTSIQVLITKTGLCYEMLDDRYGANHVGFSQVTINGVKFARRGTRYNANQISVGIELENLNDGKDPYPIDQLRAAAWWVNHWNNKFSMTRDDWVMHRDIDTQGKTDARGLVLDQIFALIETEDVPVNPAPLGSPDFLANFTILGAPRATEAQGLAFLKQVTQGEYTPGDKKLIASQYWEYGQACGVDPLGALAQMCHETGRLTSWWSQRERRNPAGIGVTGVVRKTSIQPGVGWTRDGKTYRQGFSFLSWDFAVRAHLGHLIVYAVKPEDMTDVQRQFVALDPRASAVPKANRGACPQWINLNGKWAVPGTLYAQMIAGIAAKIQNV